MDDQSGFETEQVSSQSRERETAPEKSAEKSPDEGFEQLRQGAEVLEEPPNGSFLQGLQTFVAWVKTLVD